MPTKVIPQAEKDVVFNAVRSVRRKALGLARKKHYTLLVCGSQNEGFMLAVERPKSIVMMGTRYDRQFQALHWSLTHGLGTPKKANVSIVPPGSTAIKPSKKKVAA